MELYRLKHKKTGLYYTKGSLSKRGKLYHSPNNFCTYLGKFYTAVLRVPCSGKLYKEYKEIFDELDEVKNPVFVGNPPYRIEPITFTVKADDFEKEVVNPDEL